LRIGPVHGRSLCSCYVPSKNSRSRFESRPF
jgi:hypothetical protein